MAAAQNDMLAEVGQLRRSVSMAGRFKADVEALVAGAHTRPLFSST